METNTVLEIMQGTAELSFVTQAEYVFLVSVGVAFAVACWVACVPFHIWRQVTNRVLDLS